MQQAEAPGAPRFQSIEPSGDGGFKFPRPVQSEARAARRDQVYLERLRAQVLRLQATYQGLRTYRRSDEPEYTAASLKRIDDVTSLQAAIAMFSEQICEGRYDY